MHAKDHLVSCKKCGMVFTGVEPTSEELQTYYSSYPVHDHITPVTVKRYNELLDAFEPYRKTGRIIDVGCGAGHFLECAAARGWSVHGTEYGTRALAACRSRGLEIIEGPLDPANYSPGSFDVICSFEVVEHLADPRKEWERMAGILRPGGLLYATTPNYRCIGHWHVGKEWTVVNYPEHLNYFTPKSLSDLARTQGLLTKWITTTGIIPNRACSPRSSSVAAKKDVQASQERLRSRIEGSVLLRVAKGTLNGLLNLLKVGDSMKAGFEKPLQ